MVSTMIGSEFADKPDSVIEARIRGRLFKPEVSNFDGGRPGNHWYVDTDFRYDPLTEPLAVKVSFHTSENGVEEWVFARDLLIEGIRHSVGEGDVNVFPFGADIQIHIGGPNGSARFAFPQPQINAFLVRSLISRPRSNSLDNWDEVKEHQIDNLISSILKDAV